MPQKMFDSSLDANIHKRIKKTFDLFNDGV
jgi:hypothetical protein